MHFYLSKASKNFFCIMKNSTPTPIRVSDAFGFGIFSVVMAHNTNAIGFIIPNKDNEEEYNNEAKKIWDNLFFFYPNLVIVPFKERNNVKYRDVIQELKDKKFHDWDVFFSDHLRPTDTEGLPEFKSLDDTTYKVGIIPQKLESDNSFGVSASQQSLQPEVFDFLKEEWGTTPVLLQHFNKINDLYKVLALKSRLNLYVPGLEEDKEVFGIRSIQHKKYYNMYRRLQMAVGIPGTHTWIMLGVFPNIPQGILYREGIEDWDEISEAARKAGRLVFSLKFNDNTDMKEFSRRVEELYHNIVES